MKRSILILLAGLAIGSMVCPQPIATAEVRRPTPQHAFSSGAMRSETVLREIATILRSIDGRVAKLEASVTRLTLQSHLNKPHVP